jgi:hypothetical protein
MSTIESTDKTTVTTRAMPRYLRRRSDGNKASRSAIGPSAASNNASTAPASLSSRIYKQRTSGAKGVALEARVVSQASPVEWSISETHPDADLAAFDPHRRVAETHEDSQIRRVPPIVTLMFVVGISALMWGGIVALVFAI